MSQTLGIMVAFLLGLIIIVIGLGAANNWDKYEVCLRKDIVADDKCFWRLVTTQNPIKECADDLCKELKNGTVMPEDKRVIR
jgi:hypothetical protein